MMQELRKNILIYITILRLAFLNPASIVLLLMKVLSIVIVRQKKI